MVVAISVDQFSADLFAEYRQLYSQGLKRLEMDGAVFPSGYQSHGATETCPGHSTILTGSRPSRTGIIANEWIDLSVARADKRIYCSEDPTVPGSDSENYTTSTGFLKVPTLGDRMKAANPASRSVSVAGKDRAAIMMGGHNTDQIWFWGGKSYVTLPGRTGPVPAIVDQINARVAGIVAKPGKPVLPAICRARSVAVPVGGGKQVGVLADRKAEDFKNFRAAIDFDAATADLAIGLIRDMKLGQGPATDIIDIGLSANDYVGHYYGPEGAEMCAQQIGLDANIGRILAALDATGVPYVVALTADHGGHDLPERNAARGFARAERVDATLWSGSFLKPIADEFRLKLDGPLTRVESGNVYLSREVPANIRPQVLSAIRAKLLAHRQVAAVFTAEELRRMPDPQPPVEEWSLAERARASFNAERSGDLVMFLKPYVTPIADPTKDSVATHGSPWIYDRRVPIIFYRPGAVPFEQPLSIETVDIMPTLAKLIGLDVPGQEIDGRCLDLDAGPKDTCGS
ncbi:alkaline phosphatase family protein [Sphingomonas colocasiae]|uniref:Alkaline phosphatase n=1 Tax=Sphingomonas colocasiae TaxID=1848973 RepID=A0ABS7PR56_9SPHN|nr:alkaline phosphatase family protein [Sphingomonas colocasiae]MBY8822494.1 alkaline phosphatase family protein [Sphingomonas colocasiae]